MKKVFFVVYSNDFSGAEAVIFEIIKGLTDKYDCYYVSRKGRINDFLRESNIKWIEINRLSVKEMKRVIRDYNPDIIHASDFMASTICALANKKAKLISHLHNNAPWIKKVCPYTIAFWYAGRKMDKILTVSDSIKEEYVFSKFLKDKIKCIGNPVSTTKILKMIEKDDYIKKYDICCVARIDRSKNPLKFVETIKNVKSEFPDIKAIWVGDGDMKNEMEEKIKAYGLENNITLLGYQKNPYKYLANSRIFLLTSNWEGYGLAVFEALTLGLPGVVSNVGGLPNIVDKDCGYLCENDEYEKAIIELLKNQDIYMCKSKCAVEKAKKLDNLYEYLKLIDSIYCD